MAMPMALNDMTPGYYVARRKGDEASEFLAVVWGVHPFMQVFSLPLNLSTRPHFVDVPAVECDFLVRLDSPTELAKV